MPQKTKDIKNGDKFNSWTVIHQESTPTKSGEFKWLCQCSCGTTKSVYASHLRSGASKQCRKCTNNNFPKRSYIGSLFSHFQSAAKIRKIEFSITKEYLEALYLKQDKKCALTKRPLNILPRRKIASKTLTTASLDRIDSSIGYVEGNVQWIYKPLNTMKGTLSNQEFIQLCKEVTLATQ